MDNSTVVTPPWREILAREVATDPRKKAGVAVRLGVSRSYVSRVMSRGSSAFKEVPKKFVDRVMEMASDVECQARGAKVPRAECHKANDPAPTHNPMAMRAWRDCQACPLKPAGGRP